MFLPYVGTVLFSKRLSRKMFQASSRVSKRLPNVSAGFSGFQTSFSGRKKSKFQKRPLNVSQKFKKDPWTAYRPAQPSFFDIGTPRGLSARKKFLGGVKTPKDPCGPRMIPGQGTNLFFLPFLLWSALRSSHADET